MQSFACRRSIRPSLDPLIEDNVDEEDIDDDDEMDAAQHGPTYGVSQARLRRLETLDSVSPAPGSSLGGMSTDNSCRLYGTSTVPLRHDGIASTDDEQGFDLVVRSPCDAPLIREDTRSVSSKNTDGQLTAPCIRPNLCDEAQDTACSGHVSAARSEDAENAQCTDGDMPGNIGSEAHANPALPDRQPLAEIDGGMNEQFDSTRPEGGSAGPQMSNHTTGMHDGRQPACRHVSSCSRHER
jgi:hypothetical protein